MFFLQLLTTIVEFLTSVIEFVLLAPIVYIVWRKYIRVFLRVKFKTTDSSINNDSRIGEQKLIESQKELANE